MTELPSTSLVPKRFQLCGLGQVKVRIPRWKSWILSDWLSLFAVSRHIWRRLNWKPRRDSTLGVLWQRMWELQVELIPQCLLLADFSSIKVDYCMTNNLLVHSSDQKFGLFPVCRNWLKQLWLSLQVFRMDICFHLFSEYPAVQQLGNEVSRSLNLYETDFLQCLYHFMFPTEKPESLGHSISLAIFLDMAHIFNYRHSSRYKWLPHLTFCVSFMTNV